MAQIKKNQAFLEPFWPYTQPQQELGSMNFVLQAAQFSDTKGAYISMWPPEWVSLERTQREVN